jgi:hypothetical protein
MAERAGSERADGVYRAYDERAVPHAAIERAIRRAEERGGRRRRWRTVAAFLLSTLVGFVLGAGCVATLLYAAVQVSEKWQWQWLNLFLG